jgi:hypothetical protein
MELMLIVPLQPIPNQSLQVSLASQATTLNIYQTLYGLFADVYLNNAALILGVICRDRTLIIRRGYLGFIGDLGFMDLIDTTDPIYTGLGSTGRYQLLYLAPADVSGLDIPGSPS